MPSWLSETHGAPAVIVGSTSVPSASPLSFLVMPSGASAAVSSRVCGRIGLHQLRAEAPDAVGAEVAFAGDGIMLVAVRLGIGLAAETAGLLRAEPDDADGAQRPAGIHDVLRGSGHDRDARRVVDRAGAEVPAVEVAADQQDRRLRDRGPELRR